MAKIIIVPHTKDYAKIEYEPYLSFESHFVPRVGEVITLYKEIEGSYNAFVCEVIYIQEGNTLVPHLHCRPWYRDNDRYLELVGQRWLQEYPS